MTLATLGQDVDAHCVLTSAPILMQMRLLMFLCDAKGCVDLDILDPREINNHLFARRRTKKMCPRLVPYEGGGRSDNFVYACSEVNLSLCL